MVFGVGVEPMIHIPGGCPIESVPAQR